MFLRQVLFKEISHWKDVLNLILAAFKVLVIALSNNLKMRCIGNQPWLPSINYQIYMGSLDPDFSKRPSCTGLSSYFISHIINTMDDAGTGPGVMLYLTLPVFHWPFQGGNPSASWYTYYDACNVSRLFFCAFRKYSLSYCCIYYKHLNTNHNLTKILQFYSFLSSFRQKVFFSKY